MTLAWAVAAGWLVTMVALRLVSRSLSIPRLLKTNYRGRKIPGSLGVVLVVPVGAGLALAGFWGQADRAVLATTAAAGAIGLLGLADDLWGRARGGGFAGHLKALARGTVTTGFLKAAGGGLLGLGVAWALSERGLWTLASGATIALAANLANLLDLRPGRTLKAWGIAWVGVVVAQPSPGLLALSAAVAGAAVAFAPADLRERGMLGDAGANLLGLVLGAAAVDGLGRPGRLALLGCLVALTLVSEAFSFSKTIERAGPLRWLDRLGRLP